METKLSPLDLAQEPIKIQIPAQDYSHVSKVRQFVGDDEKDDILLATTTHGATQTYDLQGKPKDNDNDKD